MRTFKIYSSSTFQVYNTLLLTIGIMLYVTSLGLNHAHVCALMGVRVRAWMDGCVHACVTDPRTVLVPGAQYDDWMFLSVNKMTTSSFFASYLPAFHYFGNN